MTRDKSDLKIPDWSDVDPKLRERVIGELDECKWEAASSDRKLAVAFAAATAALQRLAAGEE